MSRDGAAGNIRLLSQNGVRDPSVWSGLAWNLSDLTYYDKVRLLLVGLIIFIIKESPSKLAETRLDAVR